jgi:hypothetical protein
MADNTAAAERDIAANLFILFTISPFPRERIFIAIDSVNRRLNQYKEILIVIKALSERFGAID